MPAEPVAGSSGCSVARWGTSVSPFDGGPGPDDGVRFGRQLEEGPPGGGSPAEVSFCRTPVYRFNSVSRSVEHGLPRKSSHSEKQSGSIYIKRAPGASALACCKTVREEAEAAD